MTLAISQSRMLELLVNDKQEALVFQAKATYRNLAEIQRNKK